MQPLFSSTRPVSVHLNAVLQKLKPGQRIRVTQTVRVGLKTWTTTVTGKYRNVQYLATGITYDRGAEDEIVVPTVHFTKDNGEHSSIAIDELTRVEPIEG